MNSKVSKTVIQMNADELQKLITVTDARLATADEVQEVLAQKRIFSAAELWQIQRNRRSIPTRRHYI